MRLLRVCFLDGSEQSFGVTPDASLDDIFAGISEHFIRPMSTIIIRWSEIRWASLSDEVVPDGD